VPLVTAYSFATCVDHLHECQLSQRTRLARVLLRDVVYIIRSLNCACIHLPSVANSSSSASFSWEADAYILSISFSIIHHY
jgi:hypothetical protein